MSANTDSSAWTHILVHLAHTHFTEKHKHMHMHTHAHTCTHMHTHTHTCTHIQTCTHILLLLWEHTHQNVFPGGLQCPNVNATFRNLHTFCIEVVCKKCTIIPPDVYQRLVAFGKTKPFISTPHTLFVLERERKQQLGKVVSKAAVSRVTARWKWNALFPVMI